MNRKRVTVISSLIGAIANCRKSNNTEWKEKHSERLEKVSMFHGFDMKLDMENSTSEKLIFHVDYHCMDDGGYWDGYLSFRLEIVPSLQFGYQIIPKGYSADSYHYRKYWWLMEDYITESVSYWLDEEIDIHA